GVSGGSANGTAAPGSHVTGLSAFSNSALLVPVVNLYLTSVVLEAMQGSFAGISGLTPNQAAVAAALDSVAAQIGSKTGGFKEIAPAYEDRWGLWFTGSGEFTHIGSTTNAAGFNLESGGVTAGVDYRFTDHFAAGISLGYMNTTASLVNSGKVDVDGGRVGLY